MRGEQLLQEVAAGVLVLRRRQQTQRTQANERAQVAGRVATPAAILPRECRC